MKISKLLVVMLGLMALSCESKTINLQDFRQDATQVQEPVLYIDQYGKYSKISNTMKITLVDYGNKNKSYSGGSYVLKKYGVEVESGKRMFDVYQSTIPEKSNVDLKILYNDKNLVAWRIREFSTVDYVKRPYKNFTTNFFIFNKSINSVMEIPVINSSSDNVNSDFEKILAGDEFKFDNNTKKYIYKANIKNKNDKIENFDVVLNSSLKCISASIGCSSFGFKVLKSKY